MPGTGRSDAFLSGLVKVGVEWWGCSGSCVGGQVLLLLWLQQPILPPLSYPLLQHQPSGGHLSTSAGTGGNYVGEWFKSCFHPLLALWPGKSWNF